MPHKSKSQNISEQLNRVIESIDKFIEEVKNLEPFYKRDKTKYYVVYCPNCFYHDMISYYKYRKALEGKLYCHCKTPMKPLDNEYKNTKIRRLENLKRFLVALNPVILEIFKDDLEHWSKVKKSWWNRGSVVDVSILARATITIDMEQYDYISVVECDVPEMFARFERIAAFHKTNKIIEFANELEKLRREIPFRAIIVVYKYELGVDRELLLKHGFAEAYHIEGFKCLPHELLVSVLVKVIQ